MSTIKRVSVPLPINIAKGELALFVPYSRYELFPQKVQMLEDVFVSFSGLCVNHEELIKECHHNYPSQYFDYLNEASYYYYNAIEHPENLVSLDDDSTYLVIHHPWYNYYHWVCESIFRLWLVRKELDNLILLLPEFYKEADFIRGTLEPFKLKNIYYIPNGKSVKVKNLCLPQIKPICDSYNSKSLKQVSKFYRDYVFFQKALRVAGMERLYISRQLASRRKVINENAVTNVLFRYGFTVYYPEKTSFLEQVAVFANVRYLVGEHGSGLTNLLFMKEDSSVLELHKNQTNDLDHPSPLFWYMAEALNIKYYHQSCQTFGKEDYFEGDYVVDISLLEQNVIQMLKS